MDQSIPEQIIVSHTSVSLVVDHKVEWSFKLESMPDTWFYLAKPIALATGDRVKITITKEPVNAHPR